MNEETNDTKLIKEYLIEKNKNLISDIVSEFKEPIKSVNGVLESLKPQNLLKNFDTLSGFDPILSSIKTSISNIDDNFNNYILGQTQDRRNDFLKEAQTDKEISLQEENNRLLGLIATQSTEATKSSTDEESGGILKSMLGKIMAGGALVGGMGIGGLAGKAMGGIKNMGKVALRGLGKIALPLAVLLSAKDFYEGFGNALEITGRDDFAAKMQAGLSSVVSSFTFGLIDAKTISKSLDIAQDAIFGFILNPIQTIKDFAEKYNIVEALDTGLKMLSGDLIDVKMIKDSIESFKNFIIKIFTDPIGALKVIALKSFDLVSTIGGVLGNFIFDLIPEGKFKEGIVSVKNFIVKLFTDPIGVLKEMVEGFSFVDMLDNILSTITFGLIPEGAFKEGITKVSNFLNGFLIEPFMKIKSWFDELDIAGFIDRMIEPLVTLRKNIFSGDIFAPLTEWFDNFDIVEMLGIGPLLRMVRKFKDSITNILSNTKGFIKSLFDDDKEEKLDVRKPKTYTQKIERDSDKITVPKNERNPKYRSTTDDIQESYMKKPYRKQERISENNTQTIINTNTNNNVIRDDMSMQTSDLEFMQYAY